MSPGLRLARTVCSRAMFVPSSTVDGVAFCVSLSLSLSLSLCVCVYTFENFCLHQTPKTCELLDHREDLCMLCRIVEKMVRVEVEVEKVVEKEVIKYVEVCVFPGAEPSPQR